MSDMSDVKFQEVENMVRQYKEERERSEQAQKEADDLKKIQKNTESRLMAFMEQFNLSSQKTVYGTIVRNQRWSWKTPKEQEERNSFREFLESRGQFQDVWTVHSQTLNARCKEWQDEAAEAGDIDFSIPGIEEPSCTEYMSFIKK